MVAVASLAERSIADDARAIRDSVDGRLGALLPSPRRADELGAAMRYAVLAPGKRIRPILTVLSAWEIGPRDLRALDAGCALEMVHAASLILDDLPAMDDARERRGQAATHIKFGEDVAMLSAITLLSLAFETVASMSTVDAAMRCTLVATLARAVGTKGLASGQYADLRPKTVRDPGGAAEANHRKTGALFVAAVEMAAVIHHLDATASQPLRACATQIGQAYQMLDDMLDAAPDRAEDAGKTTLLSLLGRDAARLRLARHVDDALAGLHPAGALAGFVRSVFDQNVVAPA